MAGRKARRSFTPQQRQKLVKRVAKIRSGGESMAKACERVGIHTSQFTKWNNKKTRRYTKRAAKRTGELHFSNMKMAFPAKITVGDHVIAQGNVILNFPFDEEN